MSLATDTPDTTHPVWFEPEADCRFMVREISPERALDELGRVGFDAEWRQAAVKKFTHRLIKAHDLSAPAANILKQTCLTLGTDAGVHRGAINCTIDREAVLISATDAQLERLIIKLRAQPFGLKKLAESLSRMRMRQRHLQSAHVTAMAILNLTPDSFSDGGTLTHIESVLAHAQAALDAGATVLDVGGESTRPGAQAVAVDEECQRVVPVIEALVATFPCVRVSIDTRKAPVAQAALAAGAQMVNDVSGGTFDPEILQVVARAQCPYVLMHSQGTPDVMQDAPTYGDLLGDITGFFYGQVAACLNAGILAPNLILDPGLGFGKTVAHNLELLQRLPELVSLGFPVLVGSSRKSFLTLGTGHPAVDQREALTAATTALAIQAGAMWVRVHDADVQMPVIRLAEGIKRLKST